jgi:hypothetical protein
MVDCSAGDREPAADVYRPGACTVVA